MALSRRQQPQLQRRVERFKLLYGRNEPGDLLVVAYNRQRYPSLESFLCEQVYEKGPERVVQSGAARAMMKEYTAEMRGSYDDLLAWDDDMIPCALVYWGIGGIVASMTGFEALHQETTSWLEPNLSWQTIEKLQFDEGNRWVRFALDINRALWEFWQEDFFILPFLHRSPLDSANGIRGSELFTEMYTEPDRVKSLIDWCADWSIAIEKYLEQNDGRIRGWGAGVWDSWIADGAVFINGDPVGLISREMMREFERPYTAKLFTQTGGGFFHNHTVGLYQVDQVAETEGLLIQAFVDDPRQPSMAEALLGEDDSLRELIVAASLRRPIQAHIPYTDLDAVLDVAKHGRFVLQVSCEEEDEIEKAIEKVRRRSQIE